MRILLSNDDGYLSSGLLALYKALLFFGDVHVIAPKRNCSGFSHAVTLARPLSLHKAENGPQKDFLYFDGTPADCVRLALTYLLPHKPDLVVSGINHGQNLGEDVFYSGTVAAAREAVLLGIPAFAVSQTHYDGKNLDTAACIVKKIITRYSQQIKKQDAPPLLLNINIPNRPYEKLQGMSITRLGHRFPRQKMSNNHYTATDGKYWIGNLEEQKETVKGTDFYAIENFQVSITPLQLDLTNYAQFDQLKHWLDG